MSTDVERIASLEAQMVESTRQRDALFDKLDEVHESLDEMRHDLQEMAKLVSQYQGFARGAWFAMTTLAGMFGAALVWAWHRITGQ